MAARRRLKGRRRGPAKAKEAPAAAAPARALAPGLAGQAGQQAGAAPAHCILVPIAPLPKGNAQSIARNRHTGSLFVVNDKKIQARQKTLTSALRTRAPQEPVTGPVRLDVTFVLGVPTSWPAWKQEAALRGLVLPYTQATGSSGGIPDRGNLLKLIEDCLEKAGFLCNDSQICGGLVAKKYGAEPCYLIELTPLRELSSFVEWKALLEREKLGAQGAVCSEATEH